MMQEGDHGIITVIVAFIVIAIVISVGIQILGNSIQDCSNLSGQGISNPNYNKLIENIIGGNVAFDGGFNPINNLIYIANSQGNDVSVINSNNQITSTIPVGVFPQMVIFNPNNDFIYVPNNANIPNTISVIALNNTVIKTINAGNGGLDYIAYNSNNKKFYITNDNGTILVMNALNDQITNTINVSNGLFSIVYNPNNNIIYTGDNSNGTIYAINSTDQITTSIITNRGYIGFGVFNPINNDVYFTNTNNGTISVINTNNMIVDTIQLESNAAPNGITFNPLNNNIYVVDNNNNKVSVINSNNQIISTISLTSGGLGVIFNSNNHEILIPDGGGGASIIHVIDVNPPSTITGWANACEKANTQTQTAINLLIIILIVIAAAGIISVLRYLRQN